MKLANRFLLVLTCSGLIPLSAAFAQENSEPKTIEAADDLVTRTILIQPSQRGHFLTEEQIKKLSPEARAEVEKLLSEKQYNAISDELRNQLKVAEKKIFVTTDENAEPKKQYHYMIGVVLAPEQEQPTEGTLIQRVTEDSPALKSGLKDGDTILKVNETKISNVESLMDAIEASEGKELTLVIRRGADASVEETVKVTPVERPKETHPAPTPAEQKAFEQWFFSPYGSGGPYSDFSRFHMVYPGLVLSQNAQPLPDNLSITITRQGAQPARITVKREELTWELTEGELQKLPADIRPHVQRMLTGLKSTPVARNPFSFQVPHVIPTEPQQVNPLANTGLPLPPKPDPQISEQLKQLQRQLEELQKSVEKLQKEN